MFRYFFLKKPLPDAAAESAGKLKRKIGLLQLVMMGVGCTLGTGIFFVMAETVPMAGPAVVLSFVLAAITAGLTALCYAEVSSRLPVSGSSYTFAYMTLGEGMAMMVAACLVLEWGIAGAAVSVGWSSYLNQLLLSLTGQEIPLTLRHSPFLNEGPGLVVGGGGFMNLPAVLLVWLCTLLLLRGSRESARLNAILTLTKMTVLLLFVLLALPAFNSAHFEPFMPQGMQGVGAAAAVVFFSYIGLDAVVNASEEAVNPQRNIPLAIIGALVVVTSVYLLVAVGSIGVQPASNFTGPHANLAAILQQATSLPWTGVMLAAGAVISVFSVTLITLFGQSRIYFALARDGLLPPRLAEINPHTAAPSGGVVLSAALVTPLAAFLPSHVLWSLVSMGTLVAFITVAVSLMLLRHRHPRASAGFRVPLYPFTPLASIAASFYLIVNLHASVYELFFAWIGVALLLYFLYGRHQAQRIRAAQAQGKMAT